MATRSWNRVELIGNLTRDPELRYTPSGAAVATFSIATNRTYVSDGERKEEADFHRCVAWNKLAELCSQLLKKGNRVFVSGRLQNRTWEDQQGQTKNTTEIVVEDMLVLTSRNGSEEPAAEFNDDVSQSAPAPKPSPKPEMKDKPETPVEEKKEKPQEKPAADENVDLSDEDLPF
jgi:single-strand DNA-binding protein